MKDRIQNIEISGGYALMKGKSKTLNISITKAVIIIVAVPSL